MARILGRPDLCELIGACTLARMIEDYLYTRMPLYEDGDTDLSRYLRLIRVRPLRVVSRSLARVCLRRYGAAPTGFTVHVAQLPAVLQILEDCQLLGPAPHHGRDCKVQSRSRSSSLVTQVRTRRPQSRSPARKTEPEVAKPSSCRRSCEKGYRGQALAAFRTG